jgi:hypothetical protein
MSQSTQLLPDGFAELEPYVADWARPTRSERYGALSWPSAEPQAALAVESAYR